MHKHFVTFFSPGTFVAETTTKPITSWNVGAARAMATTITERYGARPYGLQFSTRSRGDDDLDSKVTDKSPMYYLGGQVRTIEEVEPDSTLYWNMKSNHYSRVITTNGWTQPLNDEDVVL